VIWWGILAAVLLLPFLMMVPKIHFSGNGSRNGFVFKLKALGVRLEYGTTSREMRGRFLWFKFRNANSTSGESVFQRVSQEVTSRRKVTPSTSSTSPKKPSNNLAILKLILPNLFKLLKRLLGSIHADEIYAELIVATSDPMTTAVLYGALQPVSMFDTDRRTFRVGVDFERESPDFDLRWSFSVRPIVVLLIVVTWLLTLPWRKIWKLWK